LLASSVVHNTRYVEVLDPCRTHHIRTASNIIDLAINNRASVAMNCLSTNARRIRTRKEHDASRNLAWLTWPPHGSCELLLRLVVHGRWNQWRPYRSRCNSIDSNAFRYILVTQTSCEGDDGALCRGVVEQIWPPDVGID
jgi:hypothetical protein